MILAELTKAQQKLLNELSEGPHHVASFYPPFKKLKEMGLVEEREGRYTSIAHLTEEGHSLLVAAAPLQS